MILAVLVLLPFVGGVAAWLAGRASPAAARYVALVTMTAGFVATVGLWIAHAGDFSITARGPWLEQFHHAWIPQLGVSFFLAMDGLSLLLVLLTFALGALSVLVSWREITDRVGFFHFMLLWTLAALVGGFLALDLFLFVFFFEMMLVPMYFLIAIWGHERRVYAAVKFFIFTQAGGLLMLIAVLALYVIHGRDTGVYTFDYLHLLGTHMSTATAWWLMLGFFAAFAVKLPAFPVHSWLPDAHTQAPTAGSLVLAGLLIKVGAYGIIRFQIPLFPQVAFKFAPYAMGLAVAGIIYGALLAYGQRDLKRLVAYTSVSHMGFVLLGIFAWNQLALQGAVIEILSHAFSTGALFAIVGLLQERTHTRDMERFGGLWATAPRMGAVAMIFALASLGLPGLGNFVGEFLILVGSWSVSQPATVLAAVGLVFATVYSLWLMQRVFQGPNDNDWALADLSAREGLVMALMILPLLWLGVYPQPVLTTSGQAIAAALGHLDRELRPMMHAHDILTLLPFVVLILAPVVVALVGTWTRSHGAILTLTLILLAAAGGTLAVPATRAARQVTPLLLVDGYALFFIGLLCAGTAAVALLSYRYLKDRGDYPADYYALLLLALLGGATLAASSHFASFFVGLELLSVSLYALIAYPRLRDEAVEAAVKYLVLAAVTAAFLLFGMALVYAQLGTMSLGGLAALRPGGGAAGNLVLAGGLALILVGVGFKLALVPFHMWTPDVYEGAPAPVTAFIATVSKAAVFALVLRYYLMAGARANSGLYTLLVVVAAASMIAGNLLALRQDNVKRLLAYSSIAQLGYVTVAFLAAGAQGATAVAFYLVAYTATTLAGFGVITALSTPARDADRLEDYRGLAARRPWLAGVFAVVLFSLAGLPLTAGFLAKFYVVDAGAGASLWGLLVVLVAMSAVSLYYYTRIVVAMYVQQPEAGAGGAGGAAPAAPPSAAVALGALTAVVLWLGIYPNPLIRLIEHVVRTLP